MSKYESKLAPQKFTTPRTKNHSPIFSIPKTSQDYLAPQLYFINIKKHRNFRRSLPIRTRERTTTMLKLKRRYRIVRYVVYKETLINPIDHFWTFVGAFVGIGLIGFLQAHIINIEPLDEVFLIGSFGASAVLVYGATNSPLAKPRNLLGGHLLSAFIGVSVCQLLPQPELLWLASALSVSVSIIAMQMTKTLHPPGGATALIANIGSEKIKALGYYYLLSPVLSGVAILLIVAILINAASGNRSFSTK
jgi:CBS domain-containing membrane protein